MYLSTLSPVGVLTSFDLTALPSWSVQLREMLVPGTPHKGLAVGIAYPIATGTGLGTSVVVIACLNCRIPGEDLQLIAKEGFPKADRGGNKEHLRDALKVLVNSLPTKDMEEVGAKSARLVDTYFDVIEVLWSAPPHRLVTGELDGWRWALCPERFHAWERQAPAISSVSALASAPAIRPVDVNAPPPTAPMTMGPAPSAVAAAKTAVASDDEMGPSDPLGPAPGAETKGKRKKG